MNRRVCRFTLLVLVVLPLQNAEQKTSCGGEFFWPYDGAQASADAWLRGDYRRRSEIAMQIATIEHMKWRAYYQPNFLGYPWLDYVEQPIGRREIQTGPNRWESHPVYPAPYLVPAQRMYPIIPRVESTGPREF